MNMQSRPDGRTIIYRNVAHVVLGHAPGSTALVIQSPGGEEFQISQAEFNLHLEDGLVVGPETPLPARIATVEEKDEAAFRRRIVEAAVELGRQGHSWEQRMPILRERFSDDAHFLASMKEFPRKRTIQKWLEGMRNNGAIGLVRKSHLSGNRTQRYTGLFREFVLDHAERAFLRSDRMALNKFAGEVREEYLKYCERNSIDPGPSGVKAVVAVLSEIPHGDILKARLGSKEARRRTLRASRFASVKNLMEQVEIDCTTADVFVRIFGQAIRPKICIAVDVASGMIVALRISPFAADQTLVAETIREILTPKDPAFFETNNILNRFNSPCRPLRIVSDNGSENDGEIIRSIIQTLGIEWYKPAPGHPEDKPFVERAFREVNAWLSDLPGATKSALLGAKERTEIAIEEACLSIDELEAYLQKWRYDVYAKTPRRRVQSALRRRESPMDAWMRLEAEQFLPRAPTPDELRQAFMAPQGTRKAQHYGIEYHGIQYWSDDYANFLAFAGRSAEVRIFVDPTDIRAIWFEATTGHRGLLHAKEEGLPPISFKRLDEYRKQLEQTKHDQITAASLNRLLRAEIEAAADAKAPKRAAIRAKMATDAVKKADRHPRLVSGPQQTPQPKTPKIPKPKNLPEIDDKE